MQITFGFIYYLIGLMVGVSLLMLVCLRRRARRLLLQVSEKIDLAENHMAFTAIYFVFALLGAVFVDSIWSYWTYYSETNFETSVLTIEDYHHTGHIYRQAYLSLFRKCRQYFIHERDLMLASSVLFIAYVLCKFWDRLLEYTRLQDKLEQISRENSHTTKHNPSPTTPTQTTTTTDR